LPAIVQAGIIYLVTLHLLAQGWSSHDRAHFSTRPQAAWQGAVRPGDTEQSLSSFLFLESKNRSSSSLFVQKAISKSLSRARATSQAIAITLITPPNCRTIRTPRRRPASRRICIGPSCSPCQTRGSRALTRSTVRQRTFSRLRYGILEPTAWDGPCTPTTRSSAAPTSPPSSCARAACAGGTPTLNTSATSSSARAPA
ncbi:hypothetical protein N5P37_003152, partial [Trichoderma harzianum]